MNNNSMMDSNMMSDYDDSSPQSNSGVYDSAEKDFLKELIDVNDVLDNFEHRVLRGEIQKLNPRTGVMYWEAMEGFQFINELGVREIMGRMIGKISKIARLTFKTDEEIMRDMFFFDMSVTEFFAKRSDSWELAIESAKAVKDSCVDLAWDISAASRDGFFAINLRSSYSRSDVQRTDTSSGGGKRSFLGISLPGSKK